MPSPVFRFAPSPNGRLHLGHAYSALLNADLARRLGGRLLLRLEDIDLARCRPDFVAGMLEDLAWLGLTWDGPVRRQSRHFGEYGARLDELSAAGVTYPCSCSRRQIAEEVAAIEARTGQAWPRDPDGSPLYPGTCRALPDREGGRRMAAGEPWALRLDMAAALARAPGPHGIRCWSPGDGLVTVRAADPARWGDVVLARKDTPASYHLCVVHDDALQGVTHVVRGRDLEAATDVHALLQALLRLPAPLYHHHELVTDEAGAKLSKSVGSRSLADLRAGGASPGSIRAALGFQPTRPRAR